jgi:glyoxylase-like metal-dependent hydrolase (beta-lactamase superfamily II)
MRRWLSCHGIACGLGLLLGAASAVLAQMPAAPAASATAAAATPAPTPRPVHAVEVAQNVWFVEGQAALGSAANRNFISNAGFVVTPDGVVVIDALGSPALASELIGEIRRITPLPIRNVIVTHYHADHVYGLQTLKAAGATVIAHSLGREYLNSDTARLRLKASRRELAPWIDADTRLVPADVWLDADLDLRVGGVLFEIRHVGPAHTPEDLVVNVPAAGALFSGDLVFRGRIPYVGQADSRQWIASLDKLTPYHARVMMPGHGAISTRVAYDIATTRDYLVYLRASMSEAAANLEPFDDAYAATDWSRFDQLPLFHAANRMNAYNTYLLLQGEPRR